MNDVPTHAITVAHSIDAARPASAPSTVFLGDILGHNLCLPQRMPTQYAAMSPINAIVMLVSAPACSCRNRAGQAADMSDSISPGYIIVNIVAESDG